MSVYEFRGQPFAVSKGSWQVFLLSLISLTEIWHRFMDSVIWLVIEYSGFDGSCLVNFLIVFEQA